jgi:6-phosphogluconolactonase
MMFNYIFRRILLIALPILFIAGGSYGQPVEYLYAGTFSGDIEKGIYVYSFDRKAGTLSHLQTAGGVVSPTYIELHPNKKFLYSVNRSPVTDQEDWGSVSAWSVDPATGKLTHINDQPAYGNAPCYISMDSKGRILFIANYGSGSIAAYPILDDGSLGKASKVIQHTGSSVGGERQSVPHAHCAVVSPDDKYLYAADLGTDRVKTYTINYYDKTMHPVPESDGVTEPGTGPRHLVIDADQEFCYVLAEMGGQVEVFSIDPESGALTAIQAISTLPEDFEGNNSCADIHIDPTGRFLYASNRGHNSLAIYEIDPGNGKLSLVDIASVEGDWPRNFLIEPQGDFLFVANRKSNNLVVFRRDKNSGKISNSGVEVSLPEPVCVKMLQME